MPMLTETWPNGHTETSEFPYGDVTVARAAATKNDRVYGICVEGKSWYKLLPRVVAERAAPAPRAQRTQRTDGAPTAKSICLALFNPEMDRDQFILAATKNGVKESTARTMFSDIKAGRIK